MSIESAPSPDVHRHRWALGYRQFDLLRVQDDPPTTYLTRWWLFDTPLGGVCVHRMHAGDARPQVHDHPMGFISLVLLGGYIERRMDPHTRDIYFRHVRHLNFMRRIDAHSIASIDRNPTWTLLFCAANRRTWGFWQRSRDRFGVRKWVWTSHDEFDSGHRAES